VLILFFCVSATSFGAVIWTFVLRRIRSILIKSSRLLKEMNSAVSFLQYSNLLVSIVTCRFKVNFKTVQHVYAEYLLTIDLTKRSLKNPCITKYYFWPLTDLLARDQLTQVRRQERAFHELSERLPTFAPTYKIIVGTPNYDPK
jgi:hypothetical protein